MFQTQIVSCPVCKTRLGKRIKSAEFELFDCEDCQAYVHTYKDGRIKMVLKKDEEKKRCGCGSCRELGR